jgi:hypothetical protein
MSKNIDKQIRNIMLPLHATSCYTPKSPTCECGIEEIENKLFALFTNQDKVYENCACSYSLEKCQEHCNRTCCPLSIFSV